MDRYLYSNTITIHYSLMVRATPEEHEGLAQQIRIWDLPENQIQINTYVVEVSRNDDLFGGVDWSNTLSQNGLHSL